MSSSNQALTARSDISEVLAGLGEAPRTELVDQWRALHRSEPPKGVGRRFLIGAIAHALQMRAQGRSPVSLQRRLQRVAKSAGASSGPVSAVQPLAPGARLVREWNGSTYTVDVTEDGYLMRGNRYHSLSAVARAITGARWSGPRFFGLRSGDVSGDVS